MEENTRIVRCFACGGPRVVNLDEMKAAAEAEPNQLAADYLMTAYREAVDRLKPYIATL